MRKALRTFIPVAAYFLAAGYFTLFMPDLLYAFHEGGIGYCEGCHDMHSQKQGRSLRTDDDGNPGSAVFMLKGSDPSSTCLTCHAEEGAFYNVFSSDGSQYTPGGDFYWLKKTFTSIVNGKVYISDSHSHGHNIVAGDYGLMEDRISSSAPGGTYASSAMGCISCHNPHGTITGNAANSRPISGSGSYGKPAPQGTITGNYRLLGGQGYNGGSMSNGVSFAYPAPVAVANALNWTETDSNHPAYGSGMSEWCANCHNDMLAAGRKHPAGSNARLSPAVITNYNSYKKTGDSRGMQAISYLSLVPFELGTTDTSLLNPSSSAGPDTSGKASVMCLTCHRAHASAFPLIGRWDFSATFISDSHPGSGDAGVSGKDVLNSYYGRDMAAHFGLYQRSLCNKCHVQD
ncbi:MAG: cytochrome C [Nitrospiraceae bacterium]|nr:MAG: cytochrome C [Nitrospiraceae bacterium]